VENCNIKSISAYKISNILCCIDTIINYLNLNDRKNTIKGKLLREVLLQSKDLNIFIEANQESLSETFRISELFLDTFYDTKINSTNTI